MNPTLLLLLILLSGAVPATAAETTAGLKPGCPDAQVFSAKLITDICWSCVFPIRIAGISLGGGNAPAGATRQAVCACDDPAGVPEPGLVMGFWAPARLIEVVRLPYCAPSLGGIFLRQYPRLLGGYRGTAGDTSDAIFYQYHYYAFPLLLMLDLFLEPDCNSNSQFGFQVIQS